MRRRAAQFAFRPYSGRPSAPTLWASSTTRLPRIGVSPTASARPPDTRPAPSHGVGVFLLFHNSSKPGTHKFDFTLTFLRIWYPSVVEPKIFLSEVLLWLRIVSLDALKTTYLSKKILTKNSQQSWFFSVLFLYSVVNGKKLDLEPKPLRNFGSGSQFNFGSRLFVICSFM